MKNSKKIILIIVGVLIFSVVLYFLPVNNLIGRLPYLNRFYNNTTLEISVNKGKAKVWINGVDYGESPTTVQNLPEGRYTIELEKIVEQDAFYERLSFNIDLTRNTTARVDLEIGPDNLLHGIILYYTPVRTSSNTGLLTVSSDTQEARIFVDKEFIKMTPITNLSLRDNQYEIMVVAEGYEDVEIPVLVRDNYSLNLKTYHFPIPVSFDTLEINEIADE